MADLSPISAALKALRERAGLSVREVARAIGLGESYSTYATYERAFKKPFLPMDLAQKLSKALAGRGDPPITENDVLALAGVARGAVLDFKPPNNGRRLRPETLTIVEYDVQPQAGGGAEMLPLQADGQHRMIGEWSMPADFLRANVADPSGLAVIRVEGDSMEPDYLAGERLLVDTNKRIPSPPGVYVLWDGFGLVLKRVEILPGATPPRLRIKSINPSYAEYERPMDDVQINGRVIGKWTWK